MTETRDQFLRVRGCPKLPLPIEAATVGGLAAQNWMFRTGFERMVENLRIGCIAVSITRGNVEIVSSSKMISFDRRGPQTKRRIRWNDARLTKVGDASGRLASRTAV